MNKKKITTIATIRKINCRQWKTIDYSSNNHTDQTSPNESGNTLTGGDSHDDDDGGGGGTRTDHIPISGTKDSGTENSPPEEEAAASKEEEEEEGEGSVSSMGDDWVNLSHSSQPLNISTD